MYLYPLNLVDIDYLQDKNVLVLPQEILIETHIQDLFSCLLLNSWSIFIVSGVKIKRQYLFLVLNWINFLILLIYISIIVIPVIVSC